MGAPEALATAYQAVALLGDVDGARGGSLLNLAAWVAHPQEHADHAVQQQHAHCMVQPLPPLPQLLDAFGL